MSRNLKFFVLGAVVLVVLEAGAPFALGAPHHTTGTRRSATTGVVVVNTTLAYGGKAAGTGVVLTSSGEILTNNHVIRGASRIRVTDTSSGHTYTATVVGYSVAKDIALLKLRNASGLQTALTGTSSSLHVGDRVIAVGNAGGTGVLSRKSGTLVRLGRSITVRDDDGSTVRLTGLIQTNAPLRPGDSGGPILSGGRVVGIDAAATSNFEFQTGASEGYAIPIETALGVTRKVEAGQASAIVHVGPTAYLGVALAPDGYAQDASGAWVRQVSPGSPADAAGIGSDDVITSFGGMRVRSTASLRNLVLRFAPSRVVRVTWIDRFTGTNSASVRLASGPPQ
jgi:S1-C subfamily serine protease